MKRRPQIMLIGTWLILVLASCQPSIPQPSTAPAVTVAPAPVTAPDSEEQRFPEILDAQLTRNADGTFALAVTLSSPYDTPERYADGWRVLAPDGTPLGEHTLTHDHATEQPFTRTQPSVTIAEGITTITIEGRDKVYGFGGKTLTIRLPAAEALEVPAPEAAVNESNQFAPFNGITHGITSEGFPYLGDPNASITLTDYSDFL